MRKSFSVCAVIPARGGSKSIPGKNLVLFDGQPLILHSCEVALRTPKIDRTLVYTDSQEIADVVHHAGYSVLMEPACLAEDYSMDYQWMLALLTALDPYRPDLIVHLRPTHPRRSPEIVGEAIDALRRRPEADSLRSVCLADQTPFKMWSIQDDWLVPLLDIESLPEAYNRPRQRLPLVYWQNGYVDITRYETVMQHGSMTGRRILAFLTPRASVDLDYPDQLEALRSCYTSTPTVSTRWPS